MLQWNVHHSAGTDGIVNLDRIATAMANANPDIVTINEAEKYNGWGGEDQPLRYQQLLQQKTGRTWYMHFSQEFGQWSSNGKGHVILSVYPFDSVGHTTTTPSSGLKWAGAISQATITVNYRTINLFVAHLDPYDQAMRLTQAKEVISWSSGFAENRILTGDMNAWPDQASILELNNYYNDSWTVALNKGTASASTSITPVRRDEERSHRLHLLFEGGVEPDGRRFACLRPARCERHAAVRSPAGADDVRSSIECSGDCGARASARCSSRRSRPDPSHDGMPPPGGGGPFPSATQRIPQRASRTCSAAHRSTCGVCAQVDAEVRDRLHLLERGARYAFPEPPATEISLCQARVPECDG